MIAFKKRFKEGTVIRLEESNCCKSQKKRTLQAGIDEIGRYSDVEEDGESIKRIYYINSDTLKRLVADRYNTLHKYRREGDTIVFYYNEDTKERMVLAVKPGDDLSRQPFYLKERYVVNQDELDKVTPKKGMISITKENLKSLVNYNILTSETAYVIHFNRNNVGFYL